MAQNDPKMTRTFSAIFLTEKAVPQTFSLLECMYESIVCWCGSAPPWGAGKEGHSTEEGPRILLWFSSVPTQQLSCESIVQAAIKRLEGSVWGSTFNTEGRRFHLKINTEGSIVVKVRPHTTPLSLLLLTICLKETCLMNNRCTQDALNGTQISYFVEQIQIQLQIQIQILIQI